LPQLLLIACSREYELLLREWSNGGEKTDSIEICEASTIDKGSPGEHVNKNNKHNSFFFLSELTLLANH
jgi:hypothetical protein